MKSKQIARGKNVKLNIYTYVFFVLQECSKIILKITIFNSLCFISFKVLVFTCMILI